MEEGPFSHGKRSPEDPKVIIFPQAPTGVLRVSYSENLTPGFVKDAVAEINRTVPSADDGPGLFRSAHIPTFLQLGGTVAAWAILISAAKSFMQAFMSELGKESARGLVEASRAAATAVDAAGAEAFRSLLASLRSIRSRGPANMHVSVALDLTSVNEAPLALEGEDSEIVLHLALVLSRAEAIQKAFDEEEAAGRGPGAWPVRLKVLPDLRIEMTWTDRGPMDEHRRIIE